uniref:IS1634 family transposase n=1 Tax=Brunnivagina elsteri TaxID=1247191 RepID=UPI002482F612|nr:IS1634 family transposase [Calothrix elsteri]
MFFKSASGNQTDSQSFGKIAVEYKKQMKVDSLIVADCALYTEPNIKLMSEIKWLSRVPLTIKEAQLLVSETPESEFIDSELLGYSFVAKRSNYGGIEQRWLVVQSQERKESDLRKLSQKIIKDLGKNKSALKKISSEKFACEADAIKELSKLSKQFKYHQLEKIEVNAITPEKQKLEKQESENQKTYYLISAIIIQDESKINKDRLSAGRFILATNVLEESQLGNGTMIYEYKRQQSCEILPPGSIPVAKFHVREDLLFSKTHYFLQIVFI